MICKCHTEMLPVGESYAKGRYMRQIYGCGTCGYTEVKKVGKISNRKVRKY